MRDIVERLRNTSENGIFTASMTDNYASYGEAADAITELRRAIGDALKCTPSIKITGVSKGVTQHRIVYDCGDPWEILRAALTRSDCLARYGEDIFGDGK